MPKTMTAIQTVTLTTNTASITFNSIPATYTDLVIYCAFRSVDNSGQAGIMNNVIPNSNSTNPKGQEFIGYANDIQEMRYIDFRSMPTAITGGGASMPANYFTVFTMYLPNYRNANTKRSYFSKNGNNDDNTASEYLLGIYGGVGLNGSSSAITSLSIDAGSALAANSTATLYGISNS